MKHSLLGNLVMMLALQYQPGPSVNLFVLRQDLEIGADATARAERALPIVRDTGINEYLRTIGVRLSGQSAMPTLPYRFRVVNSQEVDSVTFPGGSVYLNRGLIALAANDSELAAIVAHEIAHAAARHGTAQLTRQLLVLEPASIAAGLHVSDGWKDQLSRLGISFDARASFLRYSPDQELEADITAVQMLVKAGYPAAAISTFLKKISPSGEEHQAPAYVYSHPHGRTLNKDLQAEIDKERPVRVMPRASEGFRAFQAALGRLALPVSGRRDAVKQLAATLPNEYRHPQDYYKLSYPAEWLVTRTGPNGGIIAPTGGIQSKLSRDDVVRGVMFDLFDISERPMTLEQASNRLIASLRQHNESLQVVPGAQTQTLVDGEPGLRTVMNSRTSSELAWVVTRIYYQSLFYIVCVSPVDKFPEDQPVFEQMIRSIQLR